MVHTLSISSMRRELITMQSCLNWLGHHTTLPSLAGSLLDLALTGWVTTRPCLHWLDHHTTLPSLAGLPHVQAPRIVRGEGTHVNQAPRREQKTATSTTLFLVPGYAKSSFLRSN